MPKRMGMDRKMTATVVDRVRLLAAWEVYMVSLLVWVILR